MKTILTLLLVVSLTGCSTFSTVQTDESDTKTGIRKITTRIKTRTLFDSKSELAKLKASTTDKTQTVGVGSLSQESSGTNVVALIEAAVRAAVKAAAGQ